MLQEKLYNTWWNIIPTFILHDEILKELCRKILIPDIIFTVKDFIIHNEILSQHLWYMVKIS